MEKVEELKMRGQYLLIGTEGRYLLKVGKIEKMACGAWFVQREWFRQGYIFKDEYAFLNDRDAPCYVPELSGVIYTGNDLRKLCNNQETFAKRLFDALDWQTPEILVNELEVTGEWCFCQGCGHLYDCYENKVCPECGKSCEE